MKKILLLFVTSSITTATVVPTTLKFNDTNLPNTIFNSVNYKFGMARVFWTNFM
ncbi:hypothetical protein [Spiroplasma endosymbiont of Stenodema calcarata]|uniref:hypothetical protein n=1 Tax=Spiroplasma endosymbiont of Stenodema calcarata TaxID=3139328 RepID=UPI003CCB5CC9